MAQGYPRPSRGVYEVTVLSSAARTADTNSSDQTNYESRGCLLFLDITAGAGQINSISIQAKIGSNYLTIYTFTATISGTGQYSFMVYPGVQPSAGTFATNPINGVLPRTWRLSVDHNDATSVTYSVTAVYIP